MSAVPQLEAVPQLFIVFTLASLTIRGKSCGAPGIKNFPQLNWTELNWNRNFEGRYRKIIKKQYFSSRSSPKVLFYVSPTAPSWDHVVAQPQCCSTNTMFVTIFFGYKHKCPTPPRTKDRYLFTACGPRSRVAKVLFNNNAFLDSHIVDTDQRHPTKPSSLTSYTIFVSKYRKPYSSTSRWTNITVTAPRRLRSLKFP